MGGGDLTESTKSYTSFIYSVYKCITREADSKGTAYLPKSADQVLWRFKKLKSTKNTASEEKTAPL